MRKDVKDVTLHDTVVHDGVARKVISKALRAGKGMPEHYEFECEGGTLLAGTEGYLMVRVDA